MTTVHPDGNEVAVGCALERGSIRTCEVDAFVGAGTTRAAAAARINIGRGRVTIRKRGVHQAPVQVVLSQSGVRLLRRRGPKAVVTFQFRVSAYDTPTILRATARAHVMLAQRFLVGARRGFGVDSVTLDATTRRRLRRIAARLGSAPDQVRCEGHTDATADPGHAMDLGRRRAGAVCTYLRNRGLNARVRVVSHGKSRPLVSNRTRAGRARNRRVDIYVR